MSEQAELSATSRHAKVDWLAGEHRKEEGVQRVLFNAGGDWHGGALLVIKAVCKKQATMTSDDFHRVAVDLGLEEPHHPNAIGAVLRDAAQKGIIRRTPETKKSVRRHAHAREIRIWECLWEKT